MSKWDEYKNLKLKESCMLNNLLNDHCWNRCCLNLIELIYSWRWKLAVINFLLTIGSPLTRCWITVYLVNMTVGLNFQVVRSPFSRCGIVVSVQRQLFNSVWCRIAVFYSDCYSELFYKITIWPQNYIKKYYGPKLYKTCQISPFSGF